MNKPIDLNPTILRILAPMARLLARSRFVVRLAVGRVSKIRANYQDAKRRQP